jgi:hypothetical protein
MPHARLDRLTYTVHGTTETDLIAAARNRLTQTVTEPELWQLAIDANANDIDVSTGDDPHRHLWDWTGTVTATRRPTPKPVKATP